MIFKQYKKYVNKVASIVVYSISNTLPWYLYEAHHVYHPTESNDTRQRNEPPYVGSSSLARKPPSIHSGYDPHLSTIILYIMLCMVTQAFVII
jgi:hypothetical protein